MSISGNDVMEVDNAIQHEMIPEWVTCFLEKTFFHQCPDHDLLKNEVNRYCITCGSSICRFCITDGEHDQHKILTIYRHVYQDVVALNDMENHINCENIQPYKSNKKWVVSLNPLPHNGSGSLIEGDGACNICKRKLTDPDRFRFCSIACKVQAITDSGCCGQPPGPTLRTLPDIGRKHSRKGVPRRAPLF